MKGTRESEAKERTVCKGIENLRQRSESCERTLENLKEGGQPCERD